MGSGSYGTAYLVVGEQTHRQKVIKEIDLNNMPDDDIKAAFREVKVMGQLKHPNIVQFHDVYKTKKKRLCIVMEYADGGDLNQIVKMKQKVLKETGDTSVYFSEE